MFKKMLKLLTLTMVVAFGLMAGSVSADLVALWEFEGSDAVVADSAYNNAGALAGDVHPSRVAPGKIGDQAMEFYGNKDTGESSYVGITTDTTISPNLDNLESEFTVALWFKDSGNIGDAFYPAFIGNGSGAWWLGMYSDWNIGKVYFVNHTAGGAKKNRQFY